MERETLMNGFVLDTSVVLKWFSEYGEGDLNCALQIRESLLEGSAHFTVPELLFYELGNALRYNPHFSPREVSEAIDSVFDMGMDVARIDKKVMKDAVALAFKYQITVYDAYFLGLSHTEEKPLITADYKFFEKVKGYKGIIKLSEFRSSSSD
ncbi:MAG: type II toxin-antitoxin system VapC family toxin [Deltaproteobacteria bacterium]|nr:type II toxin-antitoxin system VapC family toxin [Deltaproteobacteria bacterium]